MANVTSSGNTTIKPTISAAKFMGASHAAGSSLENQVQTIRNLVFDNNMSISSIRSILDSASLHSHIDTEEGGSLEETNNILMDIGNAISLDFANRITEGKEEVKGIQSQKSKEKFGRAESKVEGKGRKIGSIFKNTESKAASPVQGIFGKIMSFLGLLGTGIAVNAGFEWLKDDKNKKKLSLFFNMIKENWKWILGATGLFVGAGILGSFAGAVTSIGKILAILSGPAGIAALLSGAGLAWAFWTRNDIGERQKEVFQALTETEGNTLTEKRNNLKKKLQDQLNPNSDNYISPINIVGRQEVASKIKFLEDGFYGGFSGKETIDWNTFKVPTGHIDVMKKNKESLSNLQSPKNVNMSFINLPGITEGSNQQGSSTVATAVPNISSANFSDPYRQLTPNIYGIYV